MLKDYIDKLIEKTCRTIVNGQTPSLNQTANNNSNTVGGVVTAVSHTNGMLTIRTNTGIELTGIKPTSDGPIGIGTSGLVIASSIFIS